MKLLLETIILINLLKIKILSDFSRKSLPFDIFLGVEEKKD